MAIMNEMTINYIWHSGLCYAEFIDAIKIYL